jgi:hypothetical protein
MHRVAAAIIALACWVGIGLQFRATYGQTHDIFATLWTLARFFTIISNFVLAATMTLIAGGGRMTAMFLGGLTLAILLVGIVYWILLRGLHPLSGAALTANYLLHDVSPLAMAVYWLLFVPRGKLGWSAPWSWCLFPVAYFVYVLCRGQLDHRYPYPFVDVGKLGWLQVGLNSGGIALAFILAGFALVWIDSWRPLGPGGARR